MKRRGRDEQEKMMQVSLWMKLLFFNQAQIKASCGPSSGSADLRRWNV
jgi:hypothetical protein